MGEPSIDDALEALAEQSRQAELENGRRRVLELDGAFARYRYETDQRLQVLEREIRGCRFWLALLGTALVALVIESRYGKEQAAIFVGSCLAAWAVVGAWRFMRRGG